MLLARALPFLVGDEGLEERTTHCLRAAHGAALELLLASSHFNVMALTAKEGADSLQSLLLREPSSLTALARSLTGAPLATHGRAGASIVDLLLL